MHRRNFSLFHIPDYQIHRMKTISKYRFNLILRIKLVKQVRPKSINKYIVLMQHTIVRWRKFGDCWRSTSIAYINITCASLAQRVCNL